MISDFSLMKRIKKNVLSIAASLCRCRCTQPLELHYVRRLSSPQSFSCSTQSKMDPKMFSGKPTSQQVGEIWKYLDHLAHNDPENYSKFIKKTLEEGKEQGLGPPEQFFSIQTHKKPKMIPLRPVYINACKWKQVPPPKSSTSSIPMLASEMREEFLNDKLCFVIDIALHPETIEECVRQEDEKKMLIQLLIRYTEQMTKLRLSSDYKLQENKYIGNKDNLLDMMCPETIKKAARESSSKITDEKLIDQLKKMDLKFVDNDETKIDVGTSEKNDNGLKSGDILLPSQVKGSDEFFIKESKSESKRCEKGELKNDGMKNNGLKNDGLKNDGLINDGLKNGNLINDVVKNDQLKNDRLENDGVKNDALENSSKKSELGVDKTPNHQDRLKIPKYTETEENKNGVNYSIIKIELPGVMTMKDCDVDVCEDCVELLVPGKYNLNLKLNKKIDEDETEAIFVRKTSCLILKMKCL